MCIYTCFHRHQLLQINYNIIESCLICLKCHLLLGRHPLFGKEHEKLDFKTRDVKIEKRNSKVQMKPFSLFKLCRKAVYKAKISKDRNPSHSLNSSRT